MIWSGIKGETSILGLKGGERALPLLKARKKKKLCPVQKKKGERREKGHSHLGRNLRSGKGEEV